MEKIIAYKGFNTNWTCRDFQYEVGKSYTHKGKAIACESGFHACEHPLDVLNYYPATGKLAEVHMAGATSREINGDTKVASAEIHNKVELSLHDFIGRAVKWLMGHAVEKGTHVTGDRSAASATGDRSAASATGYQSAAMGAGYDNKVIGKNGCAIFLVERDDNYDIINARGFVVGRDCKEDQWYKLVNNELVEAE